MSDHQEGDGQMNRYGARAQAHWRAYQPQHHLRITEHERALPDQDVTTDWLVGG